MSASTLIGLDIGGTKTALSLRAVDGHVREIGRFATRGVSETLDEIEATIGRLKRRGPLVIGIACGGPLDAGRGVILSPPNLSQWDEVRITEWCRTRFGARAFLMNDANANALAEWRYGAGRGTQSMIFLTAGTGMGAGLILNGRLYEGATGDAGEVGHLRLAPTGPTGYGKRGSFEGFCSGGALPQVVRYLPAAIRPHNVEGWIRAHPTAAIIGRKARAGDEVAQHVLAQAGRKLGAALAILIDTLNPECIALGTVYQANRQFLGGPMRAVLEAEVLPSALAACRIVPAVLGRDLGNYGAICVALHHLDAWRRLPLRAPEEICD